MADNSFCLCPWLPHCQAQSSDWLFHLLKLTVSWLRSAIAFAAAGARCSCFVWGLMADVFDIKKFLKAKASDKQYLRQLHRLEEEALSTESVEKAVQGAIVSLEDAKSRAFVIYGEP